MFGAFSNPARNGRYWRLRLEELEPRLLFAITDGLVVHLTFDGDVLDHSGHGNDATIVRPLPYSPYVPGIIRQGFLTRGHWRGPEDPSNNYLTLGRPADLNFGANTDFSISFWGLENVNGANADPAWIGNKDWRSGGNTGWVLAAQGPPYTANTGEFKWNYTPAGSSRTDSARLPAGGGLDDGQWHHYVVTFTRQGNGVTYLDGQQIDTQPLSQTGSLDAGKPVNIFQDGIGTYTDGLNGAIWREAAMCDLGIWRRALTSGEVGQIYSDGLQGTSDLDLLGAPSGQRLRQAPAPQPRKAPAMPPGSAFIPTPDHVVVVMLENHWYPQIIGSSAAPYINNVLTQQGAVFTNSFGIEHPSEPNYLDFFSGSNQGIHDDSCPNTFTAPNLAGELEAAGYSFGGFSEDLPYVGYTGCHVRNYFRCETPWLAFTDVPVTDAMPFEYYFPTDFTTLPTVANVHPNEVNVMHDGSIQEGDAWLRVNLDPYVQWANHNNSLLILTFDEDDYAHDNRVPTIFLGPMVTPGYYNEYVNHFTVLRTTEDMYGLPYAGQSADVAPITDIWNSGGSPRRGAGGTGGLDGSDLVAANTVFMSQTWLGVTSARVLNSGAPVGRHEIPEDRGNLALLARAGASVPDGLLEQTSRRSTAGLSAHHQHREATALGIPAALAWLSGNDGASDGVEGTGIR